MRPYLPLLLVAVLTIASAPSTVSLKDQMQRQLALTCQQGGTWSKTLQKSQGKGETLAFSLRCKEEKPEGDAHTIYLPAEVAAATEYMFDAPHIAEHFDVRQEGSCTVATRKPGHETKTPLIRQEFERDPATGKLLSWESHYLKDNLFVDLEQQVWIFFHPDGSLREHYLEVHSSGMLSDEGIDAKVHLIRNP